MRDGLQYDRGAMAPDSDLISIEPEFLRQPDGLRAAGPEDFRRFHHTIQKYIS
jgi:hypothetical protein